MVHYINQDQKIRSGGRKTTDPSMSSLIKALFSTFKSYEDYDFVETESELIEKFRVDWDPNNGSILYDVLYELLNDNYQIVKDLGKIEFDIENICYTPVDDMICGLTTLPNGLACLKLMASGDWEIPVFFIIYFDGDKLRAYIPMAGNIYNGFTKQAIGNDKDKDIQYLNKYGISYDDVEIIDFDVDLMLKDIQSRIEIVQH